MLTPFHALYKTQNLKNISQTDEPLLSVFLSSNIKVYPYQIASSLFALNSKNRGVILCDEQGLGKTYTSLIIASLKNYELGEKVLFIVPNHMLSHFVNTMQNDFTTPYFVLSTQDNINSIETLQENEIIITTYDFATHHADTLKNIAFDTVFFDEAHILRKIYTGTNKMANTLKEAFDNSFKVLVTATPMQNDIMDLYGLIYFIDEYYLEDKDTFYSRYFRQEENYHELSYRINKIAFRTLRDDVRKYGKIAERSIYFEKYDTSDKEQELYNLIMDYVDLEERKTFPKMEKYYLTLMLTKAYSSSKEAFESLITNALVKVDDTHLKNILDHTEAITQTDKETKLLQNIKTIFADFKEKGLNQKALIFTENTNTQAFLYDFLQKNGYKDKILLLNGKTDKTVDIRDEFYKNYKILISTDIGAEGYNFDFCSLVINYDLPYNALKLEQRISRCQRINSISDVLVVNFFNKNNFSDLKTLDLLRKRLDQFHGIMGISDFSISEDMDITLENSLKNIRQNDLFDMDYEKVLTENAKTNMEIVERTENALYQTFTEDIAKSIKITPDYVKQKTIEYNNDLWEIAKYFFSKHSGFILDDETRTIQVPIRKPKVFTGSALRSDKYSMTDKTLSKGSIFHINSPLAKNIFNEILWQGVEPTGTIFLENNIQDLKVAYYELQIKSAKDYFKSYKFNVIVGQTKDGLEVQNVKEIWEEQPKTFNVSGERLGQKDGHKHLERPKRAIDKLVENDILQYKNYVSTIINETAKSELKDLKQEIRNKKSNLDKSLYILNRNMLKYKEEMKNIEATESEMALRQMFLDTKKELKEKEKFVIQEKIKLDKLYEDKVKEIQENEKIECKCIRWFEVDVK